jgi:hypothetical protein
LPFEPDEVWGSKVAHHVEGSVNGHRFRAVVEAVGPVHGVVMGRDCGIGPGAVVDVVIAPEGPQRENLAEDVAAALNAEPSPEPSSTPWRPSTARDTFDGSTRPNVAPICGRLGLPRWSSYSKLGKRSDLAFRLRSLGCRPITAAALRVVPVGGCDRSARAPGRPWARATFGPIRTTSRGRWPPFSCLRYRYRSVHGPSPP